jgi:DNA-binding transcriptional MerR regulator
VITVGELAERFGLSRTTLLYYERIGVLPSTTRSAAGYRLYGDDAVERLRLVCTYKGAGLTLAEIRELLETPEGPNRGILRRRIVELDQDIARVRVQQRALVTLLKGMGDEAAADSIDRETWVQVLRSVGMSQEDMDRWHAEFERNAPQGHHSFLRWLGIPEEEALAIRAVVRRSPPCASRRKPKKR